MRGPGVRPCPALSRFGCCPESLAWASRTPLPRASPAHPQHPAFGCPSFWSGLVSSWRVPLRRPAGGRATRTTGIPTPSIAPARHADAARLRARLVPHAGPPTRSLRSGLPVRLTSCTGTRPLIPGAPLWKNARVSFAVKASCFADLATPTTPRFAWSLPPTRGVPNCRPSRTCGATCPACGRLTSNPGRVST